MRHIYHLGPYDKHRSLTFGRLLIIRLVEKHIVHIGMQQLLWECQDISIISDHKGRQVYWPARSLTFPKQLLHANVYDPDSSLDIYHVAVHMINTGA
jgi:hypothetical protein